MSVLPTIYATQAAEAAEVAEAEEAKRRDALTPLTAFGPGDLVGGKYLFLRPMGAGGMGQVWMAENTATGGEVAAKVLLPQQASSPDALERFRREAYAMARLSHRGIVRVFDLVELDPSHGSLLLVMELLRGGSLADHLLDRGPLGAEEMLGVVLPILSALAHAHGVGVVHLDLKPENVLLALEPDGKVLPKLVDFGIAKSRHESASIAGPDEIVGTPCCMSPEQIRCEPTDERSDVFSMGVLMIEALTGVNPFHAGTLRAVLHAVLETTPPPIPGLPPALWGVIERAIAKRPEDRFASAAELADALRAACPWYAPGRPGTGLNASRTSTLPPPASPWASSSRGRILTGISRRSLAVCVAAALGVVALSIGSRAAPSRIRAPAPLAVHERKHVAEEATFLASVMAAPRPSHPPRVTLVRNPGF